MKDRYEILSSQWEKIIALCRDMLSCAFKYLKYIYIYLNINTYFINTDYFSKWNAFFLFIYTFYINTDYSSILCSNFRFKNWIHLMLKHRKRGINWMHVLSSITGLNPCDILWIVTSHGSILRKSMTSDYKGTFNLQCRELNVFILTFQNPWCAG